MCGAVLAFALLVSPVTVRPDTTVSRQNHQLATDWEHYGSTLAETRFAPVDEVTAANVGTLKVAWTFRTGEGSSSHIAASNKFNATADGHGAFEATPLKIGDTLYTCTGRNVIIALDAETGKLRWRFDPKVNLDHVILMACRGVAYWDSHAASTSCARRIIEGTVDARLIAVDADTGTACKDFGDSGTVSLLQSQPFAKPGLYAETSPPTIVNDHVIVGGWVTDDIDVNMPSGVIRSFDPATGRLQWAWDSGRAAADSSDESNQAPYTPSTPNAWTIFAADPVLGLVYVPTGNPSPDHWGGMRRAFDEKYGTSIVALDIVTGAVRWSFQAVHHDLWDLDLASPPTLADIPGPNGVRPAIIQPTKSGQIFVLDRRDGSPIAGVSEKPVPQGAAAGDWTSKTQPYSDISLLPQPLTESDMWGVTPLDQMICRIRFRQARYEGPYTPPGTTTIIGTPVALGVMEWGGVSLNPDQQVIVANTSLLPFLTTLKPAAALTSEDVGWMPQHGTPFAVRFQPFLGLLKTPCSQPPWGRLIAIDLKTLKVLWDRPIGTGRDSGPFNVPSLLPITMGVPSMGGTLQTRSGLIFISGTLDQYIRAIDLHSGRELWKDRLPAGGQATPMSYIAGKSGRQFIVLSAGGHDAMGTARGDFIVAYALPK
jgi:membrane-bound PQQ-dependent dehydrogenase (glucose/quinate/shikimate family)